MTSLLYRWSAQTRSVLHTLLLVAGFISCSIFSQAQEINIQQTEWTLKELFDAVESQTDLRFVFSEDDIDLNTSLALEKRTYELNELLDAASKDLELRFQRIDQSIVVLQPESPPSSSGELLYQSVRGVVTDRNTGMTLPAASLFMVNAPEYSGATDMEGNFLLRVPIGRMTLAVSYIGYQTEVIPLLVTTGEEAYLTIALEPSVAFLNEIVVEAEQDKARSVNELAYASGRGFTIQEANRYAGTLGDPARMTRSFAGVVPARDDRNDIIIRGNSPTGIQWRLDGIEVPNPNHYGGIGLTGNTTTLLNMNLLDDSDFLMGAFPSEYGNALAGVFDLHMRDPNPQKRQYRFQTGWNGFELGTEGPFSKQSSLGTYSLTYRYSFLDLVDELGIDFGILPEFQDLTGKFDFNLGPKTKLSIIGIWGTSYIELDDHDLDSADLGSQGQFLRTGSDLALLGVNLEHRFSEKVIVKSGVSVIDNRVKTVIDTFNVESDATKRIFTDNSGETKYSFFLERDHRKNRNLFRTGIRWDTYAINYQSTSSNDLGTLEPIHATDGSMSLARVYAEDEYRFTDRLRARAGIHGQYFLLNGSLAIEPRLAIRYLATDHLAVFAAYGNHHMLQPRTVYFVETRTANGVELTNEDLDFSGAHHWTTGGNLSITNNLRLKAEAYYQHLFDIPVEPDPKSSFSMINTGAEFFIPQMDSLVNEGKGRNYGVEVTLERFLDGGLYYMINGTAYRSEYQTLNGAWRNTAFDMRYMLNVLGGYEYWISQKVAFGFDAKLTYAGGRPYVPVDEEASIAAGEVVFLEDEAYESRFGEYFRADLKIYYRINYKHVYTEFALDLQNLTNNRNTFQREFNPNTGEYKTFYQMAFFPMATFRCLF